MKLTEIATLYANLREIYAIMQKADGGHTLRIYPNQRKLIEQLDDLDIAAIFNFIDRTNRFVNTMLDEHNLKIVKKGR